MQEAARKCTTFSGRASDNLSRSIASAANYRKAITADEFRTDPKIAGFSPAREKPFGPPFSADGLAAVHVQGLCAADGDRSNAIALLFMHHPQEFGCPNLVDLARRGGGNGL
ncbi:MAG TPA: hypothetical protein VFE47_05210 [Tepidisphaeraceae bacterium]|jgi:hypothetical protein|nr:hypothetical protein [Tepidisphaeraceae bacterium]